MTALKDLVGRHPNDVAPGCCQSLSDRDGVDRGVACGSAQGSKPDLRTDISCLGYAPPRRHQSKDWVDMAPGTYDADAIENPAVYDNWL